MNSKRCEVFDYDRRIDTRYWFNYGEVRRSMDANQAASPCNGRVTMATRQTHRVSDIAFPHSSLQGLAECDLFGHLRLAMGSRVGSQYETDLEELGEFEV